MSRFLSVALILILVSTTIVGVFYPRPSLAFTAEVCGVFSDAVGRLKGALPSFQTPSLQGTDIDVSIGGYVPVKDETVKKEVSEAQKRADRSSIAQKCQDLLERTALATLKKRLLDMMVDQIIGWISGQGKPMFITDYKAFLKNAGNVAIGDFIQDAGWGAVCKPFRANLQLTLQLQNTVFSQRASCSLNKVINNFQDFYNDFAKGGWVAYNEAWKPANNPYGAFIIAYDESNRRRAEAEQAAELQATAGQGFTGQEKCTWQYKINGENAGNAVVTQGKNIPVSPPEGFSGGAWTLNNCEITTPGSVLGGVTTKAVGSSLDYLIASDDISAYASAIASAAINRLIKEGIDGLSGVSLPSISSDRKSEPTGCEGLSGPQRSACLSVQSSSQSGNSYHQEYITEGFDSNQDTLNSAHETLQNSYRLASSSLRTAFAITSSSIAATNQLIASTTAVAQCYANATSTLERATDALLNLQSISVALKISQEEFQRLDRQLQNLLGQPLLSQTLGTRDIQYADTIELFTSLSDQAASLRSQANGYSIVIQSLVP